MCLLHQLILIIVQVQTVATPAFNTPVPPPPSCVKQDRVFVCLMDSVTHQVVHMEKAQALALVGIHAEIMESVNQALLTAKSTLMKFPAQQILSVNRSVEQIVLVVVEDIVNTKTLKHQMVLVQE